MTGTDVFLICPACNAQNGVSDYQVDFDSLTPDQRLIAKAALFRGRTLVCRHCQAHLVVITDPPLPSRVALRLVRSEEGS